MNTDKVLILMVGAKSRRGKDTFYEFSVPSGYVRLSFADKLKEAAADLYGLSHEQIHGNLKDEMDLRYPNTYDSKFCLRSFLGFKILPWFNRDYKPFLTPRRILQVFGQQQRALNPTIWADYIFNKKIQEEIAKGHNKIVITDFRMKNEAEVAMNWYYKNQDQAGLYFIKVNRHELDSQPSSDISENDLNDFTFDFILNNDSTLDEYKTVVEHTINAIETENY